MRVDVIATVGEARSDDFSGKTVLVIDALRATGTIVTALANGCVGVLPVETVSQAREAKGEDDLLGGERNCKRIPGFDFGNSPLEYEREHVAGRRVVLTTTNGTRAIQKAHKALHLLAASPLNAAACAKAALHYQRDVVLLCAGTKDEFALEDGLCAGLLVERILEQSGEADTEMNDLAVAMRLAYLQSADRLGEAFASCAGGIRLARLGLGDDVAYCAEIDRFDTVPVMVGETLVAYSSSKILSRS